MPSCVALGCHRRGDAVLKIFPRKDRRRRQIWVDRVNRPGWTPTKYSALCEHHFDRDQWELPREDGKRKLKDSALPTVFVVPPAHDDSGVSGDHSYCMPLYRKIYEDGDLKADISEQGEETMPIEHIKVEVGENENFTPETVEVEEKEKEDGGEGREEEEDGGGGREEEELSGAEEDVESIQCTPDISVFPEHGEPFFPIEMVDCENDDANTFMAESDNDPLAISAEDQVQAATMKPYFGNSQKFLFIPKETKVVVNICSKAKGEPEINSSESTTTPSAKPTLKVKSLEGLLDPNVVRKSSSSISASENSKTLLKFPSAVYLREKLTLTDQPVALSAQKLESSASSKKLEFDQRVVKSSSSISASENSKTLLKSPSAVYLREKLTLTDQPVALSAQKLESSASSQKLEFDQRVVKSSSSISASENSKTLLKSPSAVYLREKLTLTDQPVALSAQKLESSASSQKLELDQRVVTLTSPKFNFPPKLKVTSTTGAAPPKLHLVSTKLAVQRDQDFFRKMPNLKLEKPVVLQPRPNILIHKPSPNILVQKPSNPNVKLVHPGLIKSDTRQILSDKNIKIAFKPDDYQNRKGHIEQSRESNKSLSFTDKCEGFKQVLLDPQHSAIQIAKQVTMDGVLEDGIGFDKQIGNNNVKAWLDSNIPADKSNSASRLRTILPKSPVQNNETPSTKNSSVIVLKPFGSSKSLDVNTGGISQKQILNIQMSQVKNRSITMYKCDQCQTPFMSPFALQVHKQKTGHVRKESQGEHVRDEDGRKYINDAEDLVTVETSESSNDSSDSELEDDDSSVVVLSENDSETDTTEEILGTFNDNYSNESDSGTGSSAEEGGQEFEVAKKSIIQTNILNTFPRQLDNSLVKIPNLGALRNLKSYEFLKLSNIIDPLRRENLLKSGELTHKESITTFDGKRKYKVAPSIRTEEKLTENRAKQFGFTKESPPYSKVKLTRENLLNNKTKVSQKTINCISKIYHRESQNEVERLKDNSEEKELIVLSSSSSSFSRGDSSSDNDDSDDETSSEDDVTSNSQRFPAVSTSEVNTDRISELIKKKKEVGLKDEVLKLKDNTNKPIVLLPRVDRMKINHLKKANNCQIDTPESAQIDTPESASEIIISDDEEINCRQKTVPSERDDNSVTTLNDNVDSDKVLEKIPVDANVSKEKILVDLNLTDENKIKKIAQNEKPIVLLSQLNLDEIKGKTVKHEGVNIEIKNVKQIKEDVLISGVNCKSSSIQRVQSVNKPYSKELSCENPSSTTHSVSLPPKVKRVESKKRNIVVRSNNKHSCYEKYKMAQISSQTNLKRITRKCIKNLERAEESSKCNRYFKKRTSLKNEKPNEGHRYKNSHEISPKFKTRKCKLCGETVPKSQFKQHVYEHMDMTSVCKVCKKKFPHSVLLHRHMKNEHLL